MSEDSIRMLDPAPFAGDEQFEWGYQGDGPLSLARAILWDQLGEDPDEDMTLAFSNEVAEHLERAGFALDLERCAAWVRDYQRRPEWRHTCERVVVGILLREPEQSLPELRAAPLDSTAFTNDRLAAIYRTVLALADEGPGRN